MILTVPSTQTLASMGSVLWAVLWALWALWVLPKTRDCYAWQPRVPPAGIAATGRQGSESQEEVATGTSIISNLIAQSIFRCGSRVCCG